MKKFVAVVLFFGCGTYIPSPQGPRVQCSGGGGAYVAPVGNAVIGTQRQWSSCEQLEADRCNPQHPDYSSDMQSGFCDSYEEKRVEHNKEVRTKKIVGWTALIVGSIVLIGLASAAEPEQ